MIDVLVWEAIVTAVPPLPPTFSEVTELKSVPVMVMVLPTYPLVPEPGDATENELMVGVETTPINPLSLPKPKE